MTDIVMPRLSDSMEEGTILKWLVDDGADVRRGQGSPRSRPTRRPWPSRPTRTGRCTSWPPRATPWPSAPSSHASAGTGPRATARHRPTAPPSPPARPARPARPPPAAPAAAGEPAAAPAVSGNGGHQPGERVKASPVARRLAEGAGVDIAELTGTGPGGRIVKADVEAAVRAPSPAPETAAPSTPPPAAPPSTPARGDAGSGKGEVTVEELTRTQQLVARRMAESRATVPDFTLTTEIDMTDAVALRARSRPRRPRGTRCLRSTTWS